jgi:hypothetical protein
MPMLLVATQAEYISSSSLSHLSSQHLLQPSSIIHGCGRNAEKIFCRSKVTVMVALWQRWAMFRRQMKTRWSFFDRIADCAMAIVAMISSCLVITIAGKYLWTIKWLDSESVWSYMYHHHYIHPYCGSTHTIHVCQLMSARSSHWHDLSTPVCSDACLSPFLILEIVSASRVPRHKMHRNERAHIGFSSQRWLADMISQRFFVCMLPALEKHYNNTILSNIGSTWLSVRKQLATQVWDQMSSTHHK